MDAQTDGKNCIGQTRWITPCLIVLMMSFFVDSVLVTVLVPLSPQLKVRFGVGDAAIGILFSSKAIVQIVASPLMAKFLDCAGLRVTRTLSVGVLCASTVLYASSSSTYWLALAARSMQGIGRAGNLLSGQSGLASLAGEHTGAIISTLMLGVASGVLIGPALGGWLAEPSFFGFDGLFWALACVVGVVLIVDTLFFYMILPQDVLTRMNAQAPAEERVGVRKLCRKPQILLFSLANFGVNFGISMLEATTPFHLVGRFGIREEQTGKIGALWLVGPISFLLFTPPSGMLADRFRKSCVTALGLTVMIAGFVMWESATSSFGGIPLLEGGLCVGGLGYALGNNAAIAAMPAVAGEEGKSASFALMDMAESLGFVFGPILSGAAGFDSGVAATGLVIGTCVILGGGALMLALWPIKIIDCDDAPPGEGCDNDKVQVSGDNAAVAADNIL